MFLAVLTVKLSVMIPIRPNFISAFTACFARNAVTSTSSLLIGTRISFSDNFVFSGTIFAAKQYVNHGHIMVNGKKVDRASYQVKEGAVISMDPAKSPAVADMAKKGNSTAPAYMEIDLENLKATLTRSPQLEEIPASFMKSSTYKYAQW